MWGLHGWTAILWLIGLTVVSTVLYALIQNNVSWTSQTVSLVLILVVGGVLAAWRRGNPYLRSIAGTDRYLFRATILERRGRRAEAVRDLSRHLERYPGNLQALKRRAELLASLSRYEDALTDLDAALTPHPDPDVLEQRGVVFLRMGAADDALSDFDGAARLRGSARGLLCAVALTELRRLDDALGLLIARNPRENHPYFTVHRHFYLGEVLRLLGRRSEANDAFESAVAGHQSESSVHADGSLHCLPIALSYLGRYQEAMALIAEATVKDSRLVDLGTHLAMSLFRGDLASAKGFALKLNATGPHIIVSVLSDPAFSSFLADESLRGLFVDALRRRNAAIARVRARHNRRGGAAIDQ